MPIQKSTFVAGTNGKLTFQRVGAELEIQVLDSSGSTIDTATISESDLRELLKDLFPVTRKARTAKSDASSNGTSRRRNAAAHA